MNDLIKTAAKGLNKKQENAILAIATAIGNKLGDFLNDAIDEVFDKIEEAIKKKRIAMETVKTIVKIIIGGILVAAGGKVLSGSK